MIEIFGSVLVALITALIGPVALIWIKKKCLKPKDELKIELNEIEKINSEMEDILEHLECDRVWVTQIHNGGHFLHSNKSMQKFSVVYEVDASGVSPTSRVFNNIPISLYSRFFIEIMRVRFIGICDYDDPTVATYGLKNGAEATGAKSSYISGLFDFGTGKLMGCIGIDFMEPKHIDDNKTEYFREKSERLAGYLSNYNKF
jgi:Asp-tRNA(Asn)/Glu-tRNA(Gln) amidotransferase C subunit